MEEEFAGGSTAAFPTHVDASCCPLTGNYANIESILACEPSLADSPGVEPTIATIDSPSSYHTADNPGGGADSGARDTPTGVESTPHGGGEDPPTVTTTSSDPPTLDAEDATLDAEDVTNGIDDVTNSDIIRRDDDEEKKDVVSEDGGGPLGSQAGVATSAVSRISTKAASPAHERRFFCREWAWTKLWACVEQRPSAKTCGVLIVGGPGTGKTALCSQLVSPTGAHGRHASQLQSRLLAFHFCHAHEAASLAVATFIRSLVVQLAESPHLKGYGAKVAVPEVVHALDPLQLQRDPDEAFRKAVVFPLLEADSPDKTLVLLIDSVDEDTLPLTYGGESVAPAPSQRGDPGGPNAASSSQPGVSRTILELLSNHHHLLPQWLLLILTARRGLHSRGLGRSFSGFRKVALDDLRRSHVVRDVQQYILCRLDSEPALRHHLSRETAEMLNQLHIKSNGCFLYLEKVLDGVAEGWVTLREIRDIPGTLNGLYLWLCQRLYPRKHFQRVLPLLSVILAARAPLTPQEVQEAVSTRVPGLGEEEWVKRWALLRRVLCPYTRPTLLLFHHSFAEWLLDVKHCTQKFLVRVNEGHAMLAMRATARGAQLTPTEVQTFAFHLARVPLAIGAAGGPPLEPFHLPLWLLCSGAPIERCFDHGGLRDPLSFRLLQEAGAHVPSLEGEEGDDEELEEDGEEDDRPSRARYEELRDEEAPEEKEEATTQTQTERKLSPVEAPLEGAPPARGQCSPEPALEEELRPPIEDGGDWRPPAADARSSSSGGGGTKRRRRKHREDPLYPYLRGGPIDGADAAGRTLLHTAAHQGDASLVGVLVRRGADPARTDRGGQTPLNLAARHGHADVVTALLAWGGGADPDHADDDGWTSLRSAAWAGHVGAVEALLKGGARADLADGDGRTALRAAAWGGHEDVVGALLRCGAAVNRADSEGRTPLIAAAYMGHGEIVSALIAGGADVNHADKDGRSALSVAALAGDPRAPGGEERPQVVTALLEGGARVDHEDKDGLTPLLVAAFEGHGDVCELLLEYDADVDHVDRSGRTPLLAAASMGHAAVVERLLFWGCYVDHIDVEGRTVLSLAAAQGSQDTVRLLLDRGLDETHRDNAGWTPLHYAAFEGHRGVCEALLEGGARVNEVDNDGKHALVLAAQEGHADVVGALLDAGAALHHTSHDGRSALRVAALEGHKDVVRLLLRRGADLHYKDADGRSTLYLLALEDRVDMAAFLVDSGADVESRDLEGRTPLHVTAWQGHARTVELLLGRGARVDAEDHERRTPLQSAAWQGNAAIVRILLQHGARADHCCSQGATALSIAAQEGHEDCVALLLQFGANPAHSDRCGRTAIKVALKGGHHRLARMLEEHLDQQKGPHAKGASGPQSSPSQTSTAETKPCSSLLCPGLAASPAESPESTFEKRRSCVSLGGHSSSKSSCNLSTSTRSSGGGIPSQPPASGAVTGYHHAHYVSHVHAHPQPQPQPQQQYHHPQPHAPPPGSSLSPILSFTQQLQQCGRGGRGRKNPSLPQPPLTPLDEPASPIYASPPISPVNETPPPPLPQRMNPVVALLDEDYALPCHRAAAAASKRHHHHPQQRSCPPSTPGMAEAPACHAAELSRKAVVVSSSSHVASHYPYTPQLSSTPVGGMGLHSQPQQVPLSSHSQVGPQSAGMGVGGSTSGFTFTQDSHMRIILGSRSPEARPKRNGIVTNPSLKAAHAKAAHILRNGLPGGRPRQNPLRPNGLSIKKETPL